MNNKLPVQWIPYGPTVTNGDIITMRVDLTDSVGYL
jgi:hypothetical protein